MTDKPTDDKPTAKASKDDEIIRLADGSPKLDFLTEADAAAQADKLGGRVEAIGVAFRVVTGD